MHRSSEGPRHQLSFVTGPAVWHQEDLDAKTWIFRLSIAQRDELLNAVGRAIGAGSTVESLRPEHVPLPGFQDLARAVKRCLLRGPGIALVRGLPVDVLDEMEISIAYLAIGWQLGTRVHQNCRGDLLTRISPVSDDESERLFKTRRAMGFHTDSVDIVGLLCVRPGESGGTSRIVCAGSVYNYMLATAPELVAALYEPVPWDQHSESSGTPRAWDLYAPITDVGGVPRIDYISWDIDNAQHHDNAPRLTARQTDAVRLFEATLRKPEFQVAMDLEAGDAQFINDRVVLHARDSFTDHPPPAPPRLLLRIWLAEENARAVIIAE